MSFLFTGRGRDDRELTEANRRYQQHIARDINDERALAGQAAVTGHRKRSGWLLLAVVTVFILAAALVRGGSENLPIARDCTEPALVVEAQSVDAGTNFFVRSTGPQDTSYILSVAGEPLQGQPDRSTAFTATPAGPSFNLTDCVSPIFLLPAPAEPGEFVVELIRYDAAGPVTVARVDMTVVG